VQGGPKVRLVFASSIAVFGVPVPPRIDDATEPHPTLSYGAQKRACEVLIGDAHRRGFIDARVLRLAGVVIRPPAANGALSGFNSDLFREPLAGRIYRCPVGADATLWISSLAKTVGNLLRVLDLPREALGAHAVINAPALCVSVQEILAALKRFDPAAAARVQLPAQPEAALSAQFGRWPRDCAFDRAMHLGLTADASLAAIIEDHLATRQIQQ
jgi:nucleoside-diphosphate-sugar epimerase